MWIVVALVTDLCLYLFAGHDIALDFLGGYLIELSLSVDNLFVFLTIFTSFGVPEQFRHRVLHYGIIGAAVLRLVFILFGVAVVSRFEWILYLFGVVLVINGVKMFFSQEEKEGNKENSRGMRLVRKFVPITEEFHGNCFFVLKEKNSVKGKRENKTKKCRYATPLFVALVVVELSDIIFAIDSVPAVFSVTTNPVIVYTSNLLAILGLRQMYFGLEKLANRFIYVKYGIATVLVFTGIKLVAEMFDRTISTAGSICFILIALSACMLASLFATKKGSV
ncbi:MAG: TerC/Alx family metal homeostasis membrane protein [Lachnospiraceae bacterium]|nr:TerC/Alx family metal homeostasis membrane protein [Lachnospiraceae bacterium]